MADRLAFESSSYYTAYSCGATWERSASQSERFCRTNRRLSDKNTARSRQATGTVPALAEGNSSPEKAASERKISGGFSAAILRGSSGIKKRGCRPCKASGGHWEPILKNRITWWADGFKPIHDGMDIRLKRDFSKSIFTDLQISGILEISIQKEIHAHSWI